MQKRLYRFKVLMYISIIMKNTKTSRTIQVDGKTYLIRGNYTCADLKIKYQSFVAKFGDSLNFAQYLITRGKIYKRLS